MENNENEMEISNAKPMVVKKMLEFIYTAKVEDLDSAALDLLELADQYQLKDLVVSTKRKNVLLS
jgi:hypothetical protein